MPLRPDETFEQMQMRLALDTVRELEDANEQLEDDVISERHLRHAVERDCDELKVENKRLADAQSKFFQQAMQAETEREKFRGETTRAYQELLKLQEKLALLENSNQVFLNDITQLEAEVNYWKQALASTQETIEKGLGVKFPETRAVRQPEPERREASEPQPPFVYTYKHPPSCPGCDDVTCRGHWR